MNKQFLIHTFSQNGLLLKSEIWNTSRPLGIGYPFHWILETNKQGIRIRNLRKLNIQEIPLDQLLIQNHVLDQNLCISIRPVHHEDFSNNWKSTLIPPEIPSTLNEFELFKKSLLSSFGILLFFLTFSFISSHFFKPKEEALIPPQFAKLILTPPKPSSASSENNSSKGEESSKRTGNIVRAFQSKEVQKSTQRLVTGGVLSLLAKSDLFSDKKSKSAINTMFNQQGGKDHSLSAIAAKVASTTNSIEVGALGGGSGNGSGTGNSVGYGKGEHAGLQGQGNSFLALDTPKMSEEGLSKDEVGKVIHSHLAEVRYCYESAMIRNSDAQGKLVVDFIIEGSGLIKSAKVNNSNIKDSSLDHCIISRLEKWKFPRPKGGVSVAVSYPFIFKALGR